MGMYCELYSVSPAEIEQLQAAPESFNDLMLAKQESTAPVNLEKAWHGLHFLLTGSAFEGEEPLCFLLKGGEPVGEHDLDYGPPRLFRPDAVARLNGALTPISGDALWSRFDRARLEEVEIYPSIWDEPEEDLREEYLYYFEQLKAFVRQASDEQKALIVLIT